jgi:hypothetical protein
MPFLQIIEFRTTGTGTDSVRRLEGALPGPSAEVAGVAE